MILDIAKNLEIGITVLYAVLTVLMIIGGNPPKGIYYMGVTILMIGLVMMK